MKRRSLLLLAAASCSLALLLAGPAEGRTLAREDFEGKTLSLPPGSVAPGKTGKGLTHDSSRFLVDGPPIVDLPVSFSGLSRGSISFDLMRKNGPDPDGSAWRTVFSILDGAGESLLLFQVLWKSRIDPGKTGFYLRGGDLISSGVAFWGQHLLLDREVPPGQWIHVTLTWDDGKREYKAHVDNVSLPTRRYLYHDGTVVTEEHARVINEGRRSDGLPPLNFTRPFHEEFASAKAVRLGVNTSPAVPGKGSSPLFNGIIDNFEIQAVDAGLISSVTDDSFRIPGISGKLVAGDKVTATLIASPGGKASFDMGHVKGIAMGEIPPTEGAPGIPAVSPGTYRGSYTIRPGDDYEDGNTVGHFIAADNVIAEPVTSASRWTIETKPKVKYAIDRKDLPADSSSKARIKLKVEDANGNPVPGRHLKLTLATTDEYTGLVGAGDFGKNVGASVETRWRGETDAWGEVEFDYVSGFAAKTVILTAKDLDSGGVAADFITTYKEASIDIALTPPVNRAAARRGIQYALKVEASRTELTADDRSRSVIRATLTDPNGTPVAGDPVVFSLSSENGRLRTIVGTTDSSGVATAEYIAGKKIGIVVVTATATLRNASGNVSITLLSDAPAKIHLAAKPQTLPADGFSRADITVKVTDINDNPNADTAVEFKVARGGGKLDHAARLTDRTGDASNRYTSGTTPGVATVVATVRSKVPTDAEMARAQNVLFAPYSPDGDEIRVEKWLKRKGESFAEGEPLVEYTVGRGPTVYRLNAPFDGTMGEQFVEYWDGAEVGQTLATIHRSPKN